MRMPILSGLNFFNRPEILDSGLQVSPGGALGPEKKHQPQPANHPSEDQTQNYADILTIKNVF